jgi:hypothetical protein
MLDSPTPYSSRSIESDVFPNNLHQKPCGNFSSAMNPDQSNTSTTHPTPIALAKVLDLIKQTPKTTNTITRTVRNEIANNRIMIEM